MSNLILAFLLLVNIVWAILWYYRKTQTLEYKIYRFVGKEKMSPRIGKDKMLISEDVLVQVFLRAGNENFREQLKDEFYLNKAVDLFRRYLRVRDNMFEINAEAPFITRPEPVAPPIDTEDLIEL